MKKHLRALVGAAILAHAATVAAEEIVASFHPADQDPALDFGSYTHPAGGNTLRLFGGAGSGSFRWPHDRPGIIWTVGDRGPNFTCADAAPVLGLTAQAACPADAAHGAQAGVGRIYPRPDYSPSIYRLQMGRNGVLRVLDVIALRKADGTPINGLLNPLTTATTEIPRDGEGRVLPQDASAIDAEALVRLPHFGGRFFIAEENSTGLVEVAATGRILRRFVPAGTRQEYTNPPPPIAPAGYDIDDSLPEVLVKRRLNRGIESLTLSHDLRHLYFIVQSPLENPDSGARDSRNIRIYKARLRPGRAGSRIQVVAEWVYQLDPVSLLQSVGVTDAARNRDLRVSEMLLLTNNRLLVIERTDQATAVFEINLRGATNIWGTAWDSLATSPSLEQTADLAAAGIVPVSKKLRFIASSLAGATPRYAEKLEGLALDPHHNLILVNDDDFGIAGQRLRVDVVKGAGFGHR